MLKKRIYLPDKCLGRDCEHYNTFTELCKTCPIYREDLIERKNRLIEAHRKAANKYYRKNKQKKEKE